MRGCEIDEARRGSADVPRLLLVLVPRAAPLARLVQALQMQRLRGIHTYRVEASDAGLLGLRVQHRREEWRLGGMISGLRSNPGQLAPPSLI